MRLFFEDGDGNPVTIFVYIAFLGWFLDMVYIKAYNKDEWAECAEWLMIIWILIDSNRCVIIKIHGFTLSNTMPSSKKNAGKI